MSNRNITPIIGLVEDIGIDTLQDAEVVANLVRLFGIMAWDHPGKPLNGPEAAYINPAGMAAIGQTPDQIAEALVYLSRFEIGSFCEIGVCTGGNFLFVSAYLRRFNPEIRCTGVDPTQYLDPQVRDIIAASDWLEFIPATSDGIVGRKFDLVFIDGDHANGWVEKDWNNVGQHAKFCMFHDLQDPNWPDVAAFWEWLPSLVKGKEMVEFLKCHPDRSTHGIGLIRDKGVRS